MSAIGGQFACHVVRISTLRPTAKPSVHKLHVKNCFTKLTNNSLFQVAVPSGSTQMQHWVIRAVSVSQFTKYNQSTRVKVEGLAIHGPH